VVLVEEKASARRRARAKELSCRLWSFSGRNCDSNQFSDEKPATVSSGVLVRLLFALANDFFSCGASPYGTGVMQV